METQCPSENNEEIVFLNIIEEEDSNSADMLCNRACS